jgi:hypothetical protein
MQYYAVGSAVDDTPTTAIINISSTQYTARHIIFMHISASTNQNIAVRTSLSQQQFSHLLNTKLAEDCTSPLVTSLFLLTYK